jgi:hypothetical protein
LCRGVARRHHPAGIAEDDSIWKTTASVIATPLSLRERGRG